MFVKTFEMHIDFNGKQLFVSSLFLKSKDATHSYVMKSFYFNVFPPIFFTFVFVSGVMSHSRMFNSYRNVTITGEVLQILTHARHFWSLSSEVLFGFHTLCDVRHPFIMVIFEYQ